MNSPLWCRPGWPGPSQSPLWLWVSLLPVSTLPPAVPPPSVQKKGWRGPVTVGPGQTSVIILPGLQRAVSEPLKSVKTAGDLWDVLAESRMNL